MDGFDIVTGASGYTGRFIAKRLLGAGREVRTVTGHPERQDPFGGRVPAFPFDFDNPPALIKTLTGAARLFNTYWVRFPYGKATYELAVENSKRLIDAAKGAGVGRVVHISIANNSPDSPFPYYSGKGSVEEHLKGSGLPYAIVRPTVLFGHGDILINNIAWMLRRFPVFAVAGSGEYGIQPVFVGDVAEIAVDAGEAGGNAVMDAAGPETFTFNELVGMIRKAVGSSTFVTHMPPALALSSAAMVGLMVGDVILTKDEVDGLTAGLLVSHEKPLGKTRFTKWLKDNADKIGREYHSELKRHYR